MVNLVSIYSYSSLLLVIFIFSISIQINKCDQQKKQKLADNSNNNDITTNKQDQHTTPTTSTSTITASSTYQTTTVVSRKPSLKNEQPTTTTTTTSHVHTNTNVNKNDNSDNTNVNKINSKNDNNRQKIDYDESSNSETTTTTTTIIINNKLKEQQQLTPEMIAANDDYELGISKINNTRGAKDYKSAYYYFKKAADAGHIKAKEELAFALLFGNYITRNITAARLLFEELASKSSSSRAQYALSFIYSTGLSVKSNQAKALVYLTFSALAGDPHAQMSLGYRYWSGITVDQSCELALNYYRRVATQVAGQINSLNNGAASSLSHNVVHRIRLYDEEENLLTQNQALLDDDLLHYYQLLADRGDIQAQYGLGLLHYQGARGHGDEQYENALHYFKRAADNGNYYAMAYMGKLYFEGGTHIKQDNQTAFNYFKKSADNNNPIGQAGLGLMYFYGTANIERDYKKAFNLFQLSADQGYVEGNFLLGVMYFHGYGTRKDYKLAVKYFHMAAQMGHVLAYYNLAQMHATGTGVIRSCQTATELYKNVAERGRWSSMFMEAHNSYKENDIEKAVIKYVYLAELGYEVAQSNVAYILDQTNTKLFTKSDSYKRALVYWNRAALQGYHIARLKLGDYYYYGYGTDIDYQQAASHYKYASDMSHNAQAMFNLAYMHENGLGLKRDIHLAKRFYDLALETANEAYIPVTLALIKLNFLFYFDFIGKNYNDYLLKFDLYWDIYLMSILLLIITTIYIFRRQAAIRAAI